MSPSAAPRFRRLWTAALAALLVAVGSTAAAPASAAPDASAETEVIRQFALEHVTLPEAMVMLRTLLDIRRLSPTPGGEAIVIRDTSVKVEAAGRLLAMIDRPAAEVEVDVQRLLVGSAALAELARAADDGSPVRVSSDRLSTLAVGGVRHLTTLSVLSGKSARYTQSGAHVASAAGAANLDLSIEPKVHSQSGEVSLEVSARATHLGERGASEGSRRLSSSLRVGDGDTYLVLGLLPEAAEGSGQVPVLALTPRIVRASGLRSEDLEILSAGATP